MARKPTNSNKITPAVARKDRLKAALKANLKRRKAQARVRKTAPSATGAQKD